MSDELKIPDDLKLWHRSLSDDKEVYFNASVERVLRLIERIAKLETLVWEYRVRDTECYPVGSGEWQPCCPLCRRADELKG